ncbi:MAG: hypothetical protein JW810_02670, partial [Sedimentisphaerales bacterium]|nr:hypothetical protein [Sedimentisphaerales bacterium]
EHIRSYRDGQSTGLESIGELALAENIPVSDFKKVADKITTRSNVFTVYATAQSLLSGARQTTEVVIDRSQTSGNIVYWHQGAYF